MSKNKEYKCAKCGASYSKKLMLCPQCGCVNERKIYQVTALEIKAYHNPDKGLQCKQCDTIFPDDIDKCPYCSSPSTKAIRLTSMRGCVIIETPSTKHWNKSGYTFSFGGNMASSRTKQVQLTSCTACNKDISVKTETCPHCGQPTGVHVCPKCQGINTKVISGASKATSIFLWGPFAANKVLSKFQCNDCGHKW